jgi:hypothetical protein
MASAIRCALKITRENHTLGRLNNTLKAKRGPAVAALDAMALVTCMACFHKQKDWCMTCTVRIDIILGSGKDRIPCQSPTTSRLAMPQIEINMHKMPRMNTAHVTARPLDAEPPAPAHGVNSKTGPIITMPKANVRMTRRAGGRVKRSHRIAMVAMARFPMTVYAGSIMHASI